jgi:hypothetical protein
MPTPHKHAALIKAWADGATIQYQTTNGWLQAPNPSWNKDVTYRIQPTIKECWVPVYLFEGEVLRTGSSYIAEEIAASAARDVERCDNRYDLMKIQHITVEL